MGIQAPCQVQSLESSSHFLTNLLLWGPCSTLLSSSGWYAFWWSILVCIFFFSEVDCLCRMSRASPWAFQTKTQILTAFPKTMFSDGCHLATAGAPGAGVPHQRLYLHAFLIRKVLSYFRNCVKLEDRLKLWKIISLRWADGNTPWILSGVFHR